MKRVLSMAAVAAALLVGGAALAAAPDPMKVRETAAGTLRVVQTDGGTVTISVGATKLLRTEQYMTASIVQTFPDNGPARLALIEFVTGGTACPSLFGIVDVTGAKPIITKEFGTCSDGVDAALKGEALTVSMPRMTNGKTATYTYANGKLREPR